MSGSRSWRTVTGSALRGRWRHLVALVAWSAVAALPPFALGRAVAGATDAFIDRRPAAGCAWLALVAAAAVPGALGQAGAYRRVAAIVEPLRDDLVRAVVDAALRRSTRPAAPPDAGALARLTQVEIARDTLGGLLLEAISLVTTAGAALLGLATLAPVAAAVVAPPLLAAAALLLMALPAAASSQRAALLADEACAETMSAVVESLRDVTACGAEDVIREEVDARLDAQVRAADALARVTMVRSLATATGSYVPLVAVVALAPWLLRRGLSAGAVLGALAYIAGGLHPALYRFGIAVAGSGARLAVVLRRIADAGEPQSAATTGTRPLPARCDLELRSVTFAYGPHAEPVVRDLDLAVPHGDHLAIVGPSGIGKSTLAALMTGVLRPTGGDVRLGCVPVAELDRIAWLRHRALVPQEAYVFAGTLRENLAYLAAGDPSRRRLDEAVEAVGMGAVLDRVGGYDGPVDPGALSAGERQLVALARVYLAPAEIVVLDEATCHLDPAAEARAERAIALLPRTLVVIAHRMSSALRARRVLVLDGASALVGTHESLLASSDLYRDLVGHWNALGPVGTPRPHTSTVGPSV